MWLLGIGVLTGQVMFRGEVFMEIEFVYVVTLFSLAEIMGSVTSMRLISWCLTGPEPWESQEGKTTEYSSSGYPSSTKLLPSMRPLCVQYISITEDI